MAVSSAILGAKLENLLISSTATASAASASTPPVGLLCKPWTRGKYRVSLNRRRYSGNLRCEAESDGLGQVESINAAPFSGLASGLSALELLKTSAADRYTKEKSNIIVIGVSIHTAPVEMREKLAVPEAEWPTAIGKLCSLNVNLV